MRVARVLPDIRAVEKVFDYLVPEALGDQVRAGTLVRVALAGRRVRGWVLEVADQPDAAVGDRQLQPIAKVTGWGPPADLVELTQWAAWRWAGARATLLATASPPHAVSGLPAPPSPSAGLLVAPIDDVAAGVIERARAAPGASTILRLPPAADPFGVVAAAAALGPSLVLTPSVGHAAHLAARLRRNGHAVALAPRDWARAAAGGCTVVGARAAAWAPVPGLAAVVVLDFHDEGFAEERAPTWNAARVAAERARRAGVPCVLVSPIPPLQADESRAAIVPSRADERAGWPVVDVIDRTGDDPRTGLFSERLVPILRGGGPVVCVLNRKGRARLLACAACGTVARCERCDAAVEQVDSTLQCRRCGFERPVVCLTCGSQRFKNLRAGVTRVREELEALVGESVGEVTSDSDSGDLPDAAVLVGTEAVLHRVAPPVRTVVFLDFDQELLAPRYRAGEQALALLVRAARLLGGRADGGRLVVQTRLPRHEVIQAALHAAPDRLTSVERARRQLLGFPPFRAMALVSGAAAEPFVAALRADAGLEILGPDEGRWMVRAATHRALCDALAAIPRPPGRLRIEVDPVRA